MKRIYILLLAIISSLSLSAQELVVASYNIRNDNQGDAQRGNGWAQRCPVICEQIEWNDVDVFETIAICRLCVYTQPFQSRLSG